MVMLFYFFKTSIPSRRFNLPKNNLKLEAVSVTIIGILRVFPPTIFVVSVYTCEMGILASFLINLITNVVMLWEVILKAK